MTKERMLFATWSLFLVLSWLMSEQDQIRYAKLCNLPHGGPKEEHIILFLIVNIIAVVVLGAGLLKKWWDET